MEAVSCLPRVACSGFPEIPIAPRGSTSGLPERHPDAREAFQDAPNAFARCAEDFGERQSPTRAARRTSGKDKTLRVLRGSFPGRISGKIRIGLN